MEMKMIVTNKKTGTQAQFIEAYNRVSDNTSMIVVRPIGASKDVHWKASNTRGV